MKELIRSSFDVHACVGACVHAEERAAGINILNVSSQDCQRDSIWDVVCLFFCYN